MKDIQQSRRSRYFYDNQSFDSKPEICFYLYCKDFNLNIKKSSKAFSYNYENVIYSYFPDFEIEGKWQNPFNHNLDEKYEAKHQFLIKNNVIILYENEYQKYIEEKYGRNYLKDFKEKN